MLPSERDAGQGSIFIIALVAMAFVLTSFFVDVSRSLHAHGASLDVASQAARAAADQVTQESLRSGEPNALRIDPRAAKTAAQAWLSEAGATGDVRIIDGNTVVSVTARVPCKPTMLAALGFKDLSKEATASATLLVGVPGSGGQPIARDGESQVRVPGGQSGAAVVSFPHPAAPGDSAGLLSNPLVGSSASSASSSMARSALGSAFDSIAQSGESR